MKNIIILLIPVLMMLAGCGSNSGVNDGNQGTGDSVKLSGTVRVACTDIIAPMMKVWADEFMKLNPAAAIIIETCPAEQTMKKLREGKSDLAIVPLPLNKEEVAAGMWSAPVALDAVIPIISFDNGFIQPLVMYGLDRDELSGVFTGKYKNWGQLTKRKANDPLKVYFQPDSGDVARTWNAYIGTAPGNIKGTAVASDAEMINTLSQDANGIGYCSILSIYDRSKGSRKDGIYILPVDFNGSGQIDDNEQLYDSFSQLSKAISSGKIPSPLLRDINIVAKTKPLTPLLKGFSRWLLTTGQNYMAQSGYINIPADKAAAAIATLK